MNKILLVGAVAALAMQVTLSVQAVAQNRGPFKTTTLTMECEQNKADGRILILNGNLLPETGHQFPDGAYAHILHYTPLSADATWSQGNCEVSTWYR